MYTLGTIHKYKIDSLCCRERQFIETSASPSACDACELLCEGQRSWRSNLQYVSTSTSTVQSEWQSPLLPRLMGG